jgi:hypothetical protein
MVDGPDKIQNVNFPNIRPEIQCHINLIGKQKEHLESSSDPINLSALENVFRNFVKRFILAVLTCSFSREVAGIRGM